MLMLGNLRAMMYEFIGRQSEVAQLNKLSNSYRSELVVIRGRRRIGKSRLVEEFAKDKMYLAFSGVTPVATTTAQSERDEFANQLAAHFHVPTMTFKDWNDAFRQLSHQIKLVKVDRPIVVLLDEISWMGSADLHFIPKLKLWWDRLNMRMENHPKITLVLCGSVSTWVEENVINSAALFGRISALFNLTDLSVADSYRFLRLKGVKYSTMDMLKILAVTGGVPWYLERIDPSITADSNIKKLCFEREGAFVGEYDRIFHDLFHDKGTIYKKIINRLGQGMCDLSEIRTHLSYSHGGTLSHYLQHLMTAGFVTKHASWSFKTEKLGKQSLYRLSDNYLSFYIKYIEPNLSKIQANMYEDITLSQLPSWEVILGFQIETLLLNNRAVLIKALGIAPSDVVADNPYVQRATAKLKGCQIDYLVQTRFKTLYVCAFKFRNRELGIDIIDSMKEKIARLAVPRGFGVAPVLIHVGGVQDALATSQYFYRILDLEDFLQGKV